MSNDAVLNNERKMTSIFERFLSLWVVLCIIAGILLGKIAPGVAQYLGHPAWKNRPWRGPISRWSGHICQGCAGGVHPHRSLSVFHDVSHHG